MQAPTRLPHKWRTHPSRTTSEESVPVGENVALCQVQAVATKGRRLEKICHNQPRREIERGTAEEKRKQAYTQSSVGTVLKKGRRCVSPYRRLLRTARSERSSQKMSCRVARTTPKSEAPPVSTNVCMPLLSRSKQGTGSARIQHRSCATYEMEQQKHLVLTNADVKPDHGQIGPKTCCMFTNHV
eukprot:353919-Chlamydomonas_euryale.AAC.7